MDVIPISRDEEISAIWNTALVPDILRGLSGL
jgi:hypothetical protein